MRNKRILMIIVIAMLFTGCSTVKEDTLLEKGKLALERHEYTNAKDILSQVLTGDSTNEDARSMYMQAVKMTDANMYESQKRYDKAIECLDTIEKLNGGSIEIKREASKKKRELKKLNEEYQKDKATRKENAKDASSKGTYKLEQDAIKANQKEQEKQEDQNKEENTEQNNNQNSTVENNQSENKQENNNLNNGGTTETPSIQPSQQDQPKQ